MSEESNGGQNGDPLNIEFFRTLFPGEQITTEIVTRAMQIFLASPSVHVESDMEIHKECPWRESRSFKMDPTSEHILLPLHHSQPSPHWTLGHIKVPEFTITWYNSLSGARYRVDAEKALTKIAKEIQRRRRRVDEPLPQFQVANCLEQDNCVDCGVHVIMNAFKVRFGLQTAPSLGQTRYVSPVLWRWAIAYGLLSYVPNYSVHQLDASFVAWAQQQNNEGVATSLLQEAKTLAEILDTCYTNTEKGWKAYLAKNPENDLGFETVETQARLQADRKILTDLSNLANTLSDRNTASKDAIAGDKQRNKAALQKWTLVAAMKSGAAALASAYDGISRIEEMMGTD